MRTVLLASLRHHTRRYVAAGLSVVIGVAFIVITNAFASAAVNGLTADAGAPYDGVGLVVSDVDGVTAARLLASADEHGTPATVLGRARLPVASRGAQLGDSVPVGIVATDPGLRWQSLDRGRFPAGPGEALADVNASKSTGVEVGDRIRVGSGARTVEATVVGLAETSPALSSPLYLTWPDARGWATELEVDSVPWSGTRALAERVAPQAQVDSTETFVAAQQQRLTNGVDTLALLVLVFVAVALFVAVMVIANTFSILFAQRMRDFALLRCVGATRRQVIRSVRLEALVIGVAASLVGVLSGALTGLGLVALVRHLFPAAGLGVATVSLAWCVGGFLLGLVVTLAASWVPTRVAMRVGPLSALRPDPGPHLGTAAGRRRTAGGVALGALGTALLVTALGNGSSPLMLLGGGACFLGLLLVGPVLVPALLRGLGIALARVLGPAGRLATDNAVRNPRRTASTTASLLVGVTLASAMLTGIATSRSALAHEMDSDHPLDATLTSTGGVLSAAVAASVRATRGVDRVVTLPGAPATISGGVGRIELVGFSETAGVVRGTDSLHPVRAGFVRLPASALTGGIGRGDPVTVTVGDHTQRLRVEVGEGWGEAALVAPRTLARLGSAGTGAIWVRATPGADAQDLGGDLSAIARNHGAEVASGLPQREYVDLQVQVLTWTVVGLLGIGILIALIGIGNTLGLSVLERARENALLRALGLTRRQLRVSMATEGVMLAVVATFLGSVTGVVFAWVGVRVMLRDLVSEVSFTLPAGQLALVALAAALSGLLACVVPARRAARVTPTEGLALD